MCHYTPRPAPFRPRMKQSMRAPRLPLDHPCVNGSPRSLRPPLPAAQPTQPAHARHCSEAVLCKEARTQGDPLAQRAERRWPRGAGRRVLGQPGAAAVPLGGRAHVPARGRAVRGGARGAHISIGLPYPTLYPRALSEGMGRCSTGHSLQLAW
jgi:hypothetical protein